MDTDRKLYLANLPQDIAEEELREVFGVYGRIEEVIVLGSKAADRTDRTGFVKFVDKEDAAAALAVLNDMYQFREDSETVRVSWARPHRDDKGHKGHGHGYGHTGQSGGKGPPMPPLPAPPTGGPPPPPPAAPPPPPMPAPKGGGGFRGPGQGEKLWVGNLPGDITETEMHKAFGQFGSVDEVNILPARSRSGQLCAFVRYATAAEAEACISGMVAFKFRPGDAEEIKIERPADRSRKGGKGDGWGKGGWGHGAASGCGGCGGCGGCSGCGYHAACGGCACGGACGGCGDGQWVQGCGGCGQRYQPY